jgi:hypothetical protein
MQLAHVGRSSAGWWLPPSVPPPPRRRRGSSAGWWLTPPVPPPRGRRRGNSAGWWLPATRSASTQETEKAAKAEWRDVAQRLGGALPHARQPHGRGPGPYARMSSPKEPAAFTYPVLADIDSMGRPGATSSTCHRGTCCRDPAQGRLRSMWLAGLRGQAPQGHGSPRHGHRCVKASRFTVRSKRLVLSSPSLASTATRPAPAWAHPNSAVRRHRHTPDSKSPAECSATPCRYGTISAAPAHRPWPHATC